MSCSGEIDHHLVSIGPHDHSVAADREAAEVGRHIQVGVVEPLDRARPPLVVIDHDDAWRQPQLTASGRSRC